MGYSYAYEVEEFLEFGMLPFLISGVPSVLLKIAAYVLTALALYTIAERRGLKNPWMAWVPVLNVWILGSISDQYRYVVKSENRSKRTILLILKSVIMIGGIVLFCLGIASVVTVVSGFMRSDSPEQLMGRIMGPVVGIFGVCVPLAGVSIAYAIIRFMALYDLYTSLDPKNSVIFLVLSIIFPVTEPFFLFFNRNQDGGMPPRKHTVVYEDTVYQQVQEEPWNREEPDNL